MNDSRPSPPGPPGSTRSTPSAPMPARRSHSARTARRVSGAVGSGQHDEVVLGAVALHERITRTRVHARPPRTQVAARPRRGQRTRGSRRNQDRCRRTNRRVALTVCSRACSGRRRDAQHLLVAQRPAGRRPVPQPDAVQRAHLGDQPGRPTSGPPWPRPGRRDRSGRQSDVHGVVPLDRLRQRRRERPAGQLDHLQRPDEPAAVRRQDPLGRLGVHLGQSRRGAAPGRARPARPPAGPAGPGRCRGSRARRATARTYSPEPPTSSGIRPRASTSSIAAGPAAGTRRRWPARSRPSTSSRWCGTPRRSAGVGFAVPMSMPR